MADNKKAVEQTRKQAAKQTAESVEANSTLKAPSASQVTAAQAEGVKEAVKEAAKDTYKALTDGNLPGEPVGRQFTGMDDIMQYERMLSLDPKAFEAAIAEGAEPAVPEEKVAGLLSLERAGQNRTPYVQAMMKRLDVAHPGEVTNAGPGYTNDIHPITEL